MIFADLVGSTEMAGGRDPERTRLLLERFYDAMAEEIRLAGGTIEKFAGDAVMAAFGAPAALEDHAERALHAALAMQRRLQELGGDALSLRIGVNTGEVVVGSPRAASSFVSGDPVNVAARLEQAAAPGEILVGERTVGLVRGAFEFDAPRVVEAKGKRQGVACRRLLRALSLMRPRGVLGLRRVFVGRGAEMATLRDAFDEVTTEGRPRLVTIFGDAGVGKSRLVREFWGWLGTCEPEPLRRTGRCLSYGEGVTYWPLAEVLREQFGLPDNAPAPSMLDALAPRQILGLTLGIDVDHGLHPLAARDRFQDAWVELIEEVATDRPLVLLIEDVHWAEDLLLDLLERIVADTRVPVLLLATARPEFLESHAGWGVRLPGASVTLEALTAEASMQLLDELLGGSLPAGLRDVVLARAEGNPFFVEEVLGTLIDLGLLSQSEDGWVLADLPSDFSVPDTVRAVVAARLDLLRAADKQGVQAASVIGRIFWAGPVYELVTEGAPDLHAIEERDLIRRRSGSSIPGEREYAIKHALTREVAYGSLPKADRAHMHAAFARWLERLGAGEEFASLLAHHFAGAVRPEDVDLAWSGREAELAELREKAISWLQHAANLAIGRMEVDDGIALLERAIELGPEPERLAELWHAIGRASILKYDGELFWTAMQASLDAAPERERTADVYGDLAFQTSLRAGMWKTRPDSALVLGWSERALELAGPGSRARAKALLAKAYEEPVDAEPLVAEAMAIADELGDLELRSFALDGFAGSAAMRGDLEGSHEWCRQRIALVPALTDPDHISLVYGYSLPAYVATGRFREALAFAEAYDDVTRRLSSHHRLHAAFLYVEVEAATGRWDAVRELAPRMEGAVAANLETPCAMENAGLLLCALAHVYGDDDPEARRLEAIVERLEKEGWVMVASVEVELAIARGELDEVERILGSFSPDGLGDRKGWVARLDGLVALGRRAEVEAEAPPLLIEGSYLEPFAMRSLGWARGDDALIARSVERFVEMGLDWHAERTRAFHGPRPA